MAETSEHVLAHTVGLVAAYVGTHQVPQAELSTVIRTIHSTLTDLGGVPAPATVATKEPAVSPKKSITPDYIVCLEDGSKWKTLKGHLRRKFGLTPDQYRAKWGLPKDYPMVAPSYSEKRSALAKAIGLGGKKAA